MHARVSYGGAELDGERCTRTEADRNDALQGLDGPKVTRLGEMELDG